MRFPDLSRLAQAPTRGHMRLDDWERSVAIGGAPSPPSDSESDEDDAEVEIDFETAESLADLSPNPEDANVVLNAKAPALGEPWLGSRDTFVVRSDPRMAAGFALLCYKRSWDKPMCYAYRGVPVSQYLRFLRPLQDDQKDRRVPGLLAFLPLHMLRKLATEYVQGPVQEISRVRPPHQANDYSIRPSVDDLKELHAWAQSERVQPQLMKLLKALPPDGLKIRPRNADDKCDVSLQLDPSKWGADANEAAALIRELRTESHKAKQSVIDNGHVYPLYNCAWSVLHNAQSALCYLGRPSAQLLMSACVERMLAAIDPLMSRVNGYGAKMWRGVRQGGEGYVWVEAAGDDDEEWTARLIETLKSTYFSVSTEENVAQRNSFLGSGGILIEIEGPCRGVYTNNALEGPWQCYGHEEEILVAPHQAFAVLRPRLKNQAVGDARNVTTIALRVAPVMPPPFEGSHWVDDGVDPHWSRVTRAERDAEA